MHFQCIDPHLQICGATLDSPPPCTLRPARYMQVKLKLVNADLVSKCGLGISTSWTGRSDRRHDLLSACFKSLRRLHKLFTPKPGVLMPLFPCMSTKESMAWQARSYYNVRICINKNIFRCTCR